MTDAKVTALGLGAGVEKSVMYIRVAQDEIRMFHSSDRQRAAKSSGHSWVK